VTRHNPAQPRFSYKLARAVKTTLTKAASTDARSAPPPVSFDQMLKLLLNCGVCTPQANLARFVVAVVCPRKIDTQEKDMAKETGHSQPRTETADQAAEQMIKTVLNLTPWGIMHHARKHVAAAFTFTQKIGQASDLQDRMRVHAEHAQMHIDLFNERAKELSDVMAVAGNLMGAVVGQLHRHKNIRDMERKSSAHKPADDEHQTHGSKAKR
jgi:hypothetical protein